MKIKTKLCEICGEPFETEDGRKRQCETCLKWMKTVPDKDVRSGWLITDIEQREYIIKARFEAKAKNCTIIGEGYAERQIADSLRLAGKINTELEEKD